MAIGYFIHRGDRTSCGGVILEGEPNMTREGDRVTYGANGETYTISGGQSHFRSDGQRIADTLDSVSGCAYRARRIPSVHAVIYQRPASKTVPRDRVTQGQLNEEIYR
ncbi:PAAR domain-containing protein [Pseudomonas resinovorans]|uniref:PAAR domain-containing protein n=1 Tax=Metapseudomonas resinovorans TaxID=53412 RepID=A0ABT4Y7L3_METRE|nr:PAAR domain-containing protein [Pseudomonas resinovorans]MDA8484863.1 PAAR domain-containing protein [Pseudomonas resinovorans]